MILALPPFPIAPVDQKDMIDTSTPVRAQPDLATSIAPSLTPLLPTITNGYSPPRHGLEEEDDSTIKCICGNDDDDGNTVFCELCKTWQHIACYYGSNRDVPDVHECYNCSPRLNSVNGIVERQPQIGGLAPPLERKPRRLPSKLPKKRTKDSLPPNGVRSTSAQDRGSGSPRDQPPPAKRPKTNHKSSSSTSAPQVPGAQRKRAGSTAAGRIPTKRLSSPPIYRGDYYSPQFMHRNIKYTPAQGNNHLSVAVMNDCDEWLHDPEKLGQVTSKSSGFVFQRWDQPIESLEKLSPEVHHEHQEDDSLLIHGQHPVHHALLVHTDVDKDAFIGEIRGQIGLRHDYIRDPANRWQELHHPEPFVFLHDILPVYIDCRTEGTMMRFVRRSCDPNVKIQIIVKGTEYHYCLVSTREIAAHEEVTLGWQMPEKVMRLMSNLMNSISLDKNEEEFMVNWAGGILSNFGGCACTKPLGTCPLSRFDRRIDPRLPAPPPALLSEKSVKVKKPRKSGAHVSPLSTGRAVNSRAASEAVNGELDDIDDIDTRSASGSSRSKAPSRDGTPAIGLGVELSAREKRKIQEQERLFGKMEEEEQTGGRKKKRNSAGSALNTPSVNTSNQLGFSNSNDPSPVSTHAEIRGLANGSDALQKQGATSAIVHPRRTVRPVYTEGSTQTDPEPATPEPFEVTIRKRFPDWKPKGPMQRRLERLRKIEEWGRQALAHREAAAQAIAPISPVSEVSAKDEVASATNGVLSEVKSHEMPPPPLPSSSRRSASPAKAASSSSNVDSTDDVKMTDADDTTQQATPTSSQEGASASSLDAPVIPQLPFKVPALADIVDTAMVDPALLDPALQSASTQSEARTSPVLAVDVNADASSLSAPIVPAKRKSPSPSLHVTLPPPPTFPSSTTLMTPSTYSALGTPTPTSANPLTSPAVAQSPNGIWSPAPLTSPSLITTGLVPPSGGFITQPSPLKKKMSLSDYLKRKKSERQIPGASGLSAITPGTELTIEQSMDSGESKSSPAPELDALSVITAEPEGMDEVKEEPKDAEGDATAVDLPPTSEPMDIAASAPVDPQLTLDPIESEPPENLDAITSNNADATETMEPSLQPIAPMAQMFGPSNIPDSTSDSNVNPNLESAIESVPLQIPGERRDSKSEVGSEAMSIDVPEVDVIAAAAAASVATQQQLSPPLTADLGSDILASTAVVAPMAPMLGAIEADITAATQPLSSIDDVPANAPAPVAPM